MSASGYAIIVIAVCLVVAAVISSRKNKQQGDHKDP